jgi:hypothetical protein
MIERLGFFGRLALGFLTGYLLAGRDRLCSHQGGWEEFILHSGSIDSGIVEE